MLTAKWVATSSHVEMGLDELPLGGPGVLLESVHHGCEVRVALAAVGVLLVLSDESVPEPEQLVHRTLVLDAIPTEECLVGLLHELGVARQRAVLPETDMETLFYGHAGPAIHLVGEWLHKGSPGRFRR